MEGFNAEKCKEFVNKKFDESVIKSLSDFVAIPNLSKSFDKEWASNGLLEKAANHIKDWVQSLEIKGLKIQIIKDEGYSPLIFTEIAGDKPDKTIFFYGHFDKQPPFQGWDQGKGPTTPVIQNDRLYGRGGADDGYSTYSSMLAVKAVQEQGIPIPRIVMITQGDQQSGGHIDYYMQKLKERIGDPQVIFCLDSGTLDYEHMWLTTSLRGYCIGTLNINTLTEGVHSGDSSGVVPAGFRILNMLLQRLQNTETGQINKKFCVDIPPVRYEETYNLVKSLGKNAVKEYPFFKNTQPVSDSLLQQVMNRTWKPQLTVTGITGLPKCAEAGNVMLPKVSAKLSLRLPPTANSKQLKGTLQKLLTENPPYDADVTMTDLGGGNGWNSPDYSQWLNNALKEAAQLYFNKPLQGQGEGGSIPLMGLLSSMWPKAQFVVTGVLGPNSNAHGPNQFLDIPYTKKLTQAMAHVVAKACQ